MSLQPLLDLMRRDETVRRVLGHVGTSSLVDIAAAKGARAPLIGLLTQPADAATVPVLAVTATGREAGDLATALRSFLPAASVVEFPSWETLPHERLSPRSDTVGRRLAVLRRIVHPDREEGRGRPRVVLVPVRAALQPLATPSSLTMTLLRAVATRMKMRQANLQTRRRADARLRSSSYRIRADAT